MQLVMAEFTPEPATVTFTDFWILYPRHEAKKDAMKAWHGLSATNQMAACTALVEWRRVFLMRDSVNFIPLPATWIRGERWEDELPETFLRAQIKPKANQEFPVEAETKRAPMPDNLRALLAALKGKI